MDEKQLLTLLKTDAEQGMRQMIHVFAPAVHKICASLLARRQCEDIEEAEADVFVKLWKNREKVQLSETYSLKSYLFAIARNVCIDRLRSASPETLSLESAVEMFRKRGETYPAKCEECQEKEDQERAAAERPL